ncbi:hypothetical protein GQ43DRAFT_434313 [Delitschia confertaspora ATCC 74209]|uniref:Uncharacterized protein n=1 Tax=Delitschia confertaspora ATCC 74209 TaxID=1513339 RepID=A0A9P4JHI2_9PLEO|nr:hypothetical protein GQ43DRAFT_434313 [Delitschia confertaspora ATCC 74209]
MEWGVGAAKELGTELEAEKGDRRGVGEGVFGGLKPLRRGIQLVIITQKQQRLKRGVGAARTQLRVRGARGGGTLKEEAKKSTINTYTPRDSWRWLKIAATCEERGRELSSTEREWKRGGEGCSSELADTVQLGLLVVGLEALEGPSSRPVVHFATLNYHSLLRTRAR